MIQLLTADALRLKVGWDGPLFCDSEGCEEQADQVLLAGPADKVPPDVVAMCQQHLIAVEAMLRGARKRGPRVSKWGEE